MPTTLSPQDIIDAGTTTFRIEIQELQALQQGIGAGFVEAVQHILACQGRVVVSGLGKSGHIARKISATLASTGTPSFFMHAAEALHGDLGMLTAHDVLIGISYSGSGAELMSIIARAKRLNTPIIAICGQAHSELATSATVFLNIHVQREACPLNLAPTASTTASLVMGDALAVACLQARGFSQEDFARSHPGGTLGRRLLTRVNDIMRQGKALPLVPLNATIPQALKEMSAKGMGMTIVINEDGQAVGIFTDGDLRRLILQQGDIRNLPVTQGMSTHPYTVLPSMLAVEAATLMDNKRLNQILVADENRLLLGALHMHDLLAAKVI